MRSTSAPLLDPMNTNSLQSSSNDLAGQSAALKGASLAFQKTIAAKSKPKPPPPSPQHNGALVAATSATRDQTPASSPLTRTPRTIGRQTTGSTVKETGHTRDPDRGSPARNITVQYSGQNRNGSTLTPARSVVDPKSPSFIAATLAASRSGSPAPSGNQAYPVQTPVRVRRKQSIGSQSATSSIIDPEGSETESIRPTGTLISMFEVDRSANVDPVKKSSTPMTRAGSPPKTSSPLSRVGIITSPGQLFGSPRQSSPLSAPKLRPRTPPPPMRKLAIPKDGISAKLIPGERLGSTQPADQLPRRPPSVKQKAAPPPIRAPKPQRTISQATIIAYSNAATSAPSSGPGRPVSSSSDDTFVSASSTQSPTRRSPRQQPSSPIRSSPPALPPPRRSTAMQRATLSNSPSRSTTPGTNKAKPTASAAASTTTLPLPSLTDAMVASSLASVRASQTPRAPSPPPLPSRRNRGNSLSDALSRIRTQHSGRRQGGASGGVSRHHTGNSSRPPSPVPRSMPLTLRQDRTGEKDKEDEKRRKKTSKGSRRHAHHEGSRKRWREEIREKERKRYEGLWASNRGHLTEYLKPGQGSSESLGLGLGVQGYEAPEDCVLNIVVRELWRRSRLPDDELAEVWDLVDRTGRGMLGKQEFVVGTWLIDQRLKGRKIPTKVGESVWDSARGWGGGKK